MDFEKIVQDIISKIKDLESVIIVKLKIPHSLPMESVSKIIQVYENKLNNIKLDDNMTPLEAAKEISNLIRVVPIFHNKEEVDIELLSSEKTEDRLKKMEERIKALEEKMGGN